VYREKVKALGPDVWAERPAEVVEAVLGSNGVWGRE
jgi:hypothetical protein